jgi:hypothetical protein
VFTPEEEQLPHAIGLRYYWVKKKNELEKKKEEAAVPFRKKEKGKRWVG